MAIRSDTAGNELNYLLDVSPGDIGALLEIGCGDGRLMRKYADCARKVVGIDLPPALPLTGAEPLPEPVSVAAASGVHLPFPACCFDEVLFALSF